MEKPLILTWGGNLKSVSDQGVLEGKAIVFGSERSPDISSFKDFFTSDTYVHPEESFTTPLFFEHGLSYRKPIGKALVYKTEQGWDATAMLDMDNALVQARFPEIKAGGWGFSSGAVGHIVDREKKSNGTHHIIQWAVGELSITKTPAEPKALIHSVKSLDEYYNPMMLDEDVNDTPSDHELTHDKLMEVIQLLIEQISKKNMEEIVVPQLEEIKTQLAEMKESFTAPVSVPTSTKEGDNPEELTVLKSENEEKLETIKTELETQLAELQSSFNEKEALLSEKMALLSETQAELETKSQELTTLEEALTTSQGDVEALNKKVETLKKASIALAKSNFNL